MNLHDAIETVLKEQNRPMTAKDIALVINEKDYYSRNDGIFVQSGQIMARVKNYSSLFENINGLITLLEYPHWSNVINSYLYLKETLRGIFRDFDIQYIIAVLFFYRRLLDINNRSGRGYPINFINENDLLEDENFIDGKYWVKRLKDIEDYFIAPEGVFREVSALLYDLDDSKSHNVLSILKRIDTSSFNDFDFGNIYEYLLYQNSKEFSGYEHSTPETVRYLLPQLLQIKDNDSVFDPVAGVGGLLSRVIGIGKKITLKGTEINRRIAQLGNMNLIMYGYNGTHTIEAKDCFDEINNERKFDFIIGDLPINGIINSYEHYVMYNEFGIGPPKSGKGFSSLVLFSYYKLSEKGKAVITVSDSFLSKGGKEREARDILLKNDAVEAIISLPKGTYRPYTESRPSIIIINKNKPRYLQNKIKFIRATATEESKKFVLLNIEEVIKEYTSERANNKLTQIIDLDEIRDDLSLSADVYSMLSTLVLSEGTGRIMKDVTVIRSGASLTKEEFVENGQLSVVKVENLSKDILDVNLNINSITSKVHLTDKYKRSIVNQNCVLIARIGDSLKPTIFRPEPEQRILLHSGVFALIPKGESLDLEYLYYQLYSDFVIEQVNLKRKGSLIPVFNKSEVEQTVIIYEDEIALQKKIVNSEKAKLIAAESKRLEETKRILGYEEEVKEAEINIVRTITHQLKHSLSGIDALIKKIEAIAYKNDIGESKEYKDNDPALIKEEGFETPENGSLRETIKLALKKSSSLNQILTDVKKAIHLELKFSQENLYSLLNEFKNEFKDVLIEIKGKKDVEISLSKSHIEDLFNTLINNAIQHSGLSKEKLRVTFSVKEEENVIKIEYRNNGKTIGISEKEFKSIATKSHNSKGTGVGGYYINKIVEAHSGILVIDETVITGVQMIIELPLKNETHG